MEFNLKTLFFLLSLTGVLNANFDLKKADVRKTFEEMVRFHVEHHEINPIIMERSLKLFIERFDTYKMYLTKKEAQVFYSLPSGLVEKGISAYYADDLTLFSQANSLLKIAIQRARFLRDQVEKELVLSSIDIEPSRGQTYLCFAKDEEELKERIRNELTRILIQEKALNDLDEWTPKGREKIFRLWEKRFCRKEKEYMAQGSEGEHYLALHTLKSLGLSLDAHSTYFSSEEAHDMRTSLEKQFEGVGVVLREGVDGIYIDSLVNGGPAMRSGKVEPGDQIIAIDGVPTDDMTYTEVLKAMKGHEGKGLALSLKRRKLSKVVDVSLKREKIVMSDGRLQVEVAPYGGGQIGILNLPSFYEGSHATGADHDIKEAIQKLKRQGGLKGVILDLRENTGGFLTQAVKVSGLFISRGVVVISKYARGEMRYLRNLGGRIHYDGPLIILTSRASASAAEIVAQALQDYGVALIVGDEETYGKGTIQYQTVTDPFAKSFYKVTVGRYYTVSGRSTQIEGVKADIVVPTIFSSYKIGERYLEYPLSCDQVPAAFVDPLSDIDYKNRSWFQKNYLPNVHQADRKWTDQLPILQAKSRKRLRNNENFSLFISAQEKLRGSPSRAFRRIANPPWGDEDLQKNEAICIIKDMIDLSDQTQTP